MSIWYKYGNYKNTLAEEETTLPEGIRPIIVSKGTLGKNEFIQRIADMRMMNRPMSAHAVETIFEAIEQILSEGYNLTIDGFGTFQLSAAFRKDIDESDRHRAESVEVKGVLFKAHPMLRHRLGYNNFERKPKDALRQRRQR